MGFDNVLKFQQKREKKNPKVFFKEICYSSCWLSSPEQSLQNHSSVPTPCPTSSTSVFFLKQQKGFKSMGPMSLTSLFSLNKTGFESWVLMSSIVQSFMDQKDFFPFDYWNWKKSCTILKSLINCCGKISLQGYLVAFVKRPLTKNQSSNKLGQVKARPTELC